MVIFLSMDAFSEKEEALLQSLDTPAKVQDFLDTIPMNHEVDGIDTIKSPLRVLRERSAHCIEAAILGAYILSLHGYPPLLMYLKADGKDFDHVIAPFKEQGLWGALSKTNHAVLRYREPVYKTPRELVMSYFHEYTGDDGTKTLRAYSDILDLRIFEPGWEVASIDLWGIDEELEHVEHYPIVSKALAKKLRPADPIEQKAGALVEWKRPRARK